MSCPQSSHQKRDVILSERGPKRHFRRRVPANRSWFAGRSSRVVNSSHTKRDVILSERAPNALRFGGGESKDLLFAEHLQSGLRLRLRVEATSLRRLSSPPSSSQLSFSPQPSSSPRLPSSLRPRPWPAVSLLLAQQQSSFQPAWPWPTLCCGRRGSSSAKSSVFSSASNSAGVSGRADLRRRSMS